MITLSPRYLHVLRISNEDAGMTLLLVEFKGSDYETLVFDPGPWMRYLHV